VSRQWIRNGLILMTVGLSAIGCASQTVPPVAPTTSISSAPTVAPNAPTAAPASSAGSTGNVVRLVAVPGKSEARYRVREQLAGVSLPSDAIGKTSEITGTIVGKMDGTIVSAESKFVVNLQSLQSDRSQRDGFLRSSVLQTNQYPNAVFVPTQAPGLPTTLPASGEATFKLIGDLTVRNVTKPVTWDVTCKAQGNAGTCQASTAFQFEYFGLTPPKVPVVLSVEDNIKLELDLALQTVN
jgi:polyisoprenoid-binding protein YceI